MNDCSMYICGVFQPSPAQEDCACVDAVWPSTEPESWSGDTSGTKDDAAGGTVIGYEYVNEPSEPPIAQVPDGLSEVAADEPAGPPSVVVVAVAASTTCGAAQPPVASGVADFAIVAVGVARVTAAETDWVAGSSVEASGVSLRQETTCGVVSAHAGNSASDRSSP